MGEELNPFEKYIGKNVKAFFDDGEAVRYKPGTFTGYNEQFIFISINDTESEAIAISKIIRIEFLEER